MISDRNGRPLAVSVPVSAIWADPKEVNAQGGIGYDNRWKALADALSLPLDQLASRINANPKGRFVYLARQVNPAVSSYLRKTRYPPQFLRPRSLCYKVSWMPAYLCSASCLRASRLRRSVIMSY